MNLKALLLAGVLVCLLAVPLVAAAAPFGQNGDVVQTQDYNGTNSANCNQTQQQTQTCNGICTCNGTQQQTQNQLRQGPEAGCCTGNNTGQQFQYRYSCQNRQGQNP